MPEFLEAFIKSLSPEDAEELWEFLDGSASAVQDMIALASEATKQ
jgi:hypothetical protein